MASPFEPPGERDLPGGDAGPVSDSFVTRLRSGDRDAFVRYFDAHRLSVFGLVRCLVPADEAVAVTTEAFVVAYRQILLDDGAVDLESRLYRAALAACRDHAAPTGPRGEALSAGATALRDDTDLARRFGQALRAVDDRLAVALLLHDVHGLRPQTLAQALDLPVDAAKALLFKAREAFLAAFETTEPQRPAACRLAEQVAAGGVGRPATDADEIPRLRGHASYCRTCRKVARSWPAGALGLALVAARPPLPAALQVPPVFVPVAGPRRDGVSAGRTTVAAGGVLGAATLVAAGVGRALASRAVAYAVAAVCLVAVAGMAAYVSQLDLRPAAPPSPSAASHAPVARVREPTSTHGLAGGTHGRQAATAQTTSRGAGAASAGTVAVVRTVSVVGGGSPAGGPGGTQAAGGQSTGPGQAGGSDAGGTAGRVGVSAGATGTGGVALGEGWSGGGRHTAGGSSWSGPGSRVVGLGGCLDAGHPSRLSRHRSHGVGQHGSRLRRSSRSQEGSGGHGGGRTGGHRGGGQRAGGRHGWAGGRHGCGGGHARRSGSGRQRS
jgi:DNA-directed RNA polymerase specialized sigma24 family protein